MYIYVYICMYTHTHTYAPAYGLPAQACSRSSARSAARRRRTSSPSMGQGRTPRRTHGVLPLFCTIVPPYPPGVRTSEPHAQSRAAAPPRVVYISGCSARLVVQHAVPTRRQRRLDVVDVRTGALVSAARSTISSTPQSTREYSSEYSQVLLGVLALSTRGCPFEYSWVPL